MDPDKVINFKRIYCIYHGGNSSFSHKLELLYD